MPAERQIQISNLPKIDSFEKSKIADSLNTFYDRIAKIVNNQFMLSAHFKQHEQQGKRTKHSVHLHLKIPGKSFNASAANWSITIALQQAVKTLQRETIEKIKAR